MWVAILLQAWYTPLSNTLSPLQFTYGCLYLLFEAYPIVFTEGHNFNPGESGLMFLPLLVGGLTGIIVVCHMFPMLDLRLKCALLVCAFSQPQVRQGGC